MFKLTGIGQRIGRKPNCVPLYFHRPKSMSLLYICKINKFKIMKIGTCTTTLLESLELEKILKKDTASSMFVYDIPNDRNEIWATLGEYKYSLRSKNWRRDFYYKQVNIAYKEGYVIGVDGPRHNIPCWTILELLKQLPGEIDNRYRLNIRTIGPDSPVGGDVVIEYRDLHGNILYDTCSSNFISSIIGMLKKIHQKDGIKLMRKALKLGD